MTFFPRDDALSWGRVIRRKQRVAFPRFREDLPRLLSGHESGTVLPVGLRRSYGDSVLNSEGRIIAMSGLDRFMALDTSNGILSAEAGVTLSEIMRRVVPHGFFLPVTPGTRSVTLGGAIANDVHGKNHHRAGTFGRHVLSFGLLRHDGEAIAATAEGIFSRGNWSAEGGLVPHNDGGRLSVPLDAPSGLLNRLTVGAFSHLYHATQTRKAGSLRQHYGQFFHPLDGIADWNRLYGRRGFWQYQCAIPRQSMKEAVAALLKAIIASGQASFLAVLKTFGDVPSPGLLSFPMEGATLALDFCNRGAKTFALFEKLDAIVREARGRLYAAKDGRIPKDIWAAGYPELERFLAYADPNFSSDFWRRVKP